ncbi:MAG: hypothetical protein ACR2HO_00320 [Rubrobacteraceae bacterium]|nr:hypothetical protein [Rubrobacter sp.]
MGLDVYTGTLTRYYSGDWETFWERAAREAGVDSIRVQVGVEGVQEVGKSDPQKTHQVVLAWRKALEETISDASDPLRLDWDESSGKPYFTDKPDWEGYAALMLHAAYAMRPDMEPPEEVPDDSGATTPSTAPRWKVGSKTTSVASLCSPNCCCRGTSRSSSCTRT